MNLFFLEFCFDNESHPTSLRESYKFFNHHIMHITDLFYIVDSMEEQGPELKEHEIDEVKILILILFLILI